MAAIERYTTSVGGSGADQLRRRSLTSLAGRAFMLIMGVGAALFMACSLVPAQSSAPAPSTPVVESWVDIVRPIQIYGLVGTEFARLPLRYSAERFSSDGGRRDSLTFGSYGSDAPYLQLSFDRMNEREEPILTMSAALDRLNTATRISVTRLSSASVLETRFGGFDVADLRLVDDLRSTPCVGFRSKPSRSDVLRIAGVACGTSLRPLGRDLLACIIDRIDLVSAGSDSALKSFFVDAERRRGRGCAPAPTVAAGLSKITWLDANALPPPMKTLSGDRPTR